MKKSYALEHESCLNEVALVALATAKSLHCNRDFNSVQQNCCSCITHLQVTASGKALSRSRKQKSPVSCTAASILRKVRHKENFTLPQVQLAYSLHLASSALLICIKSQDSPFASDSQFACSYRGLPGTWLYPAQSAAVTIAIDQTDATAFLFGAAAQARKAGLHSNSINATLSF